MATWESLIVARLAVLRAEEGPNFDRHWRMALRSYPMRSWGHGNSAPRLFDETGAATDTQLGFFKRVCSNAYGDVIGPVGSGNGPAVRHFQIDLIRVIDDSSPARRSTMSRGRYRAAA